MRLLLRLVGARRRGRAASATGQQGGTRRDFLDALLQAQEKHGFGDDLIVETLVSLTTAGISTVATTLEWYLLLMANDRAAQARARRAADHTEGAEEPYFEACILETLRLKTPLFVPRKCLADVEVAGFGLSKDTLLLPDSYRLAHDQGLWDGGPVDQFLPERFLGPERSLLQSRPSLRPRCPFADQTAAGPGATAFKFLPFGAGARFCPGAPLALEELRIFASALLRSFEWRAEGPGPVDLSEAYSFTLTPARPPRLIFEILAPQARQRRCD